MPFLTNNFAAQPCCSTHGCGACFVDVERGRRDEQLPLEVTLADGEILDDVKKRTARVASVEGELHEYWSLTSIAPFHVGIASPHVITVASGATG